MPHGNPINFEGCLSIVPKVSNLKLDLTLELLVGYKDIHISTQNPRMGIVFNYDRSYITGVPSP
jgi:hypothetical protein